MNFTSIFTVERESREERERELLTALSRPEAALQHPPVWEIHSDSALIIPVRPV